MEIKRIKPLFKKGSKKFFEPKRFEFPPSYLPAFYFDVFDMLFKFENFVRLFVFAVLKSNCGPHWIQTEIWNNETISSIYKKRKAQREKSGHIGEISNLPMLYLTLDELTSLILKDSLRKYFNPVFPASLEKVYKTKLYEIV